MIGSLKQYIGHRNPLRMAFHRLRALFAALWFGLPARRLVVIGITGTDGKTTTASMTAHVLRSEGLRAGMATTAFFDDGTGIRENPTHLTSISPWRLQRLLRAMMKNGCTHAVLECSSHGLAQHRLDWTFPKVAAITNLAPEHLDYHGSMEQYARDKAILFHMLRGRGTKVLNGDDAGSHSFTSIPSQRTIVWFARGNGIREAADDETFWLSNPHSTSTAVSATVHDNSLQLTAYSLQLPIPGLHNLENALCAIGIALSLDIPLDRGIAALQTFRGVPGRLERIEEGQPFHVFVDFAVTAQAYEKTLQTLRSMTPQTNRVLVLCSCCGNRMRAKRAEIGRVCSQLADVVVATEDETYGEDPVAVLDQLWSGIDRGHCDAHRIADRREAIAFLLKNARPGDSVVFCGMGPFSTFTTLRGRIPWDERKIVREMLKKMDMESDA